MFFDTIKRLQATRFGTLQMRHHHHHHDFDQHLYGWVGRQCAHKQSDIPVILSRHCPCCHSHSHQAHHHHLLRQCLYHLNKNSKISLIVELNIGSPTHLLMEVTFLSQAGTLSKHNATVCFDLHISFGIRT